MRKDFVEEKNLLDNLRWLVKEEARLIYERLEMQWEQPLANRVHSGKAVEGLVFDSYHISGRIKLLCQHNESVFREGDLVYLHKNHPMDDLNLLVSIEEDNENDLVVQVIKGDTEWLKATENTGWLMDEGTLDMLHYYIEALNAVETTYKGINIILPLLMGKRIPQIIEEEFSRAWEKAEPAGLNELQTEAVAMAVSTDLAHLVMGPPGTGKTFVLAHIVSQLVEQGDRVLVTGLTHRSINNALNKIHKVDEDLVVWKVGPTNRTDDLDVPNAEDFYSTEASEMTKGYVIGATPFSTRSQRLRGVEFDVVIFDEASQITLPLAIMGMLAGEKFIFIGDDNQLPPVTPMNRKDIEGVVCATSIFGYLCDRGYETMLEVTYRMNDELTRWPSRMFYENRLVSAEGVKNRKLQLKSDNDHWKSVLSPDKPIVFLDVGNINTTKRSYREAELVSMLTMSLIESGLSPDQIGIISPFRSQCRLIRSNLRKLLGNSQFSSLVVDTVERMQGQEREAILVSLTSSSKRYLEGIGEFYYQPERLNVTVTRPRSKLILVGSHKVFDITAKTEEMAEWLSIFNDLYQSCAYHSIEEFIHGKDLS